MGFIIVAKGRQNLLIFCELAWAIVSLVLAWFCIGRFGLHGAGIAFFTSNVFHATLLYPIVRTMTGFSWSRENWKTGLLFCCAIRVVFCTFVISGGLIAMAVGTMMLCFTTVYAVRSFSKIVEVEELPLSIRLLLKKLKSHE